MGWTLPRRLHPGLGNGVLRARSADPSGYGRPGAALWLPGSSGLDRLVRKIALKEGFGELLAKGCWEALNF